LRLHCINVKIRAVRLLFYLRFNDDLLNDEFLCSAGFLDSDVAPELTLPFDKKLPLRDVCL
jgi:hypothetical protein